MNKQLNRRSFLKQTGIAVSAGLTIGISSSGCTSSDETDSLPSNWQLWLNIQPDGRVTVYCPHTEMGQGIYDSFALIVASELDIQEDRVAVSAAPLDRRFGRQRTENSDSIRLRWAQLRQLCHSAKLSLIDMASTEWDVEPSSCSTEPGYVVHSQSGRRLSYGQLVEAISETRHSPSDVAIQTTISPPTFAGDIELPSMLHAAVTHSPHIGGTVAELSDARALARDGVVAILNLEQSVVAVAESFWAATQALKHIDVTWSKSSAVTPDSNEIRSVLAKACNEPGVVVYSKENGENPAASSNPQEISGNYYLPFDGHNTMEPSVCVADVREHSVEIWAPTQDPWQSYYVARDNGLSQADRFRERVKLKLTDVAGDRVKVHPTRLGGAFGRRLKQDHVRQAVLASKSVGKPVKLQWSRSQEIKNDFFRATSCHRIDALVSGTGKISSWMHRIAGSGILDHGIEFPYDCDSARVEISYHDFGIRTGSMRSTAHSPNAFAREVFIDSIADSLGLDPLAYRLSNLDANPRLKNVLQIAASSVNWSRRGDLGKGIGVAIHPSKESFVAQIVEVSKTNNRATTIDRITCVVDCGVAVNRDAVEAQIAGGVIFALSSALKSEIVVADGQIQNSNFHDLPMLRMHEVPEVNVIILDSSEAPGGVGEISLPPTAPALANALFNLTGDRHTSLPILMNSAR